MRSLALGADPLGGAGIAYWERIAERYGLKMTVAHNHADPTFRFMSLDWDGKIRMDCSSPLRHGGADRDEGPVRHCVCL